MSKEQVMDYVMTTPSNPNRAVLSGMLDEISGTQLPSPTESDNGKVLGVDGGEYKLVDGGSDKVTDYENKYQSNSGSIGFVNGGVFHLQYSNSSTSILSKYAYQNQFEITDLVPQVLHNKIANYDCAIGALARFVFMGGSTTPEEASVILPIKIVHGNNKFYVQALPKPGGSLPLEQGTYQVSFNIDIPLTR